MPIGIKYVFYKRSLLRIFANCESVVHDSDNLLIPFAIPNKIQSLILIQANIK